MNETELHGGSGRWLQVAAACGICIALGMSLVRETRAQTVRPEPSPEHGGTIRFVVTGLESSRGTVLCGLYHDPNDWMTPNYVAGDEAPIGPHRRAVCEFSGVPAGDYAISAFHDEDDDKELDTGLFSIPKEGYCASRNAFRRFGPPRWRDAVFHYDGEGSLRLRSRIR
jgi:uncharacterized protein (DUF2141 family)